MLTWKDSRYGTRGITNLLRYSDILLRSFTFWHWPGSVGEIIWMEIGNTGNLNPFANSQS